MTSMDRSGKMRTIVRDATTRPLKLRMRPDLIVSQQRLGRRRVWQIKDPVALRYFHLEEPEYMILKTLSHRVSIDQIRRRFARRFAPRQLSRPELHAFLGRMFRAGLLVSDGPDQATALLARRRRERWQRRAQAASQLLAIRLPAFDAEAVLRRLDPLGRAVFSPLGVALGIGLMAAAGGLMIANHETVAARWPDIDVLFRAGNLVWLALSLAVVKVLHELGHALLCRKLGARCREMGAFLLVFTPCLYCDVSDAWTLASRWRRMAITAAGIYVELLVAAAATLLWWASWPGLFHTLCLNTMIVCSVGTVLLNGNPLLKYDAYYLLSDLVGVPNLWRESRHVLREAAAAWFTGGPPADAWRMRRGRRYGLIAYAIASMAYRGLVLIAIWWLLARLLQPYRLSVVAHLLVPTAVLGAWIPHLRQAAERFRTPADRRSIRPGRALLAGVIAAGLAGLAVGLPLPRSVRGPAVVRYRAAEPVYVTSGGTLLRFVSPGKAVRRGETIATLADPDTHLRRVRLEGEHRSLRLALDQLEARRIEDRSAAVQIPTATAALRAIGTQLEEVARDTERLDLTAPCDGIVLPPPRARQQTQADGVLPAWADTPLRDRNIGCFLDRGTLVCLIGEPKRIEVIAAIEQQEAERVRIGQGVRVIFAQYPGRIVMGTVDEIARTGMESATRSAAHGGRSTARPSAGSAARKCQVRIFVDDPPPRLLAGTRATVRIAVPAESLFARAYRTVLRTFR